MTEGAMKELREFVKVCPKLTLGPLPEHGSPFYTVEIEKRPHKVKSNEEPERSMRTWQYRQREKRTSFNREITYTPWEYVGTTWEETEIKEVSESTDEGEEGEIEAQQQQQQQSTPPTPPRPAAATRKPGVLGWIWRG
jgi:hypothetical protein